MSDDRRWNSAELFESISLKIQELHREKKIPDEPSLLRINNPGETANAPFMFDMVNGRLHRADCAKIPVVSKSALYAVWQPRRNDLEISCETCRPAAAKVGHMKRGTASDIIFGFLSLLDQFSSVLIERGKEYRKSERGRQVEKSLDEVFSALEETQGEILDTALSSLDVLLEGMQGVNASLDGKGNARNGDGTRPASPSGRRRKNGKKKG